MFCSSESTNSYTKLEKKICHVWPRLHPANLSGLLGLEAETEAWRPFQTADVTKTCHPFDYSI